MLRLMFSHRWWWTTLIVIAGIILAIRLGIWQIDRHEKRQARISHLQAMQALPVLDLNLRPIPIDLDTMEYRQVVASGTYDFDRQVVLRNQVRERMSGTDPGYALVTPLLMEDGQAVLVERGWIPLTHSTPESWRLFDEPGMVYVEGILRASMTEAELGSALIDPTLAPNETRLERWNFMNLSRLQVQFPYPILSGYIQQAPGDDLEEIPYPLLEQPDLDPGAHIGFALQWFFYAGLLLIGYPIWLKSRK
jgi:surfeit locus 1 family protein